MGIPTIGLCDTDNYTSYMDWVIPCNNKGRRSLALIFYLLSREMAMSAGKISSYDEFKPTLEEFETPEKTEAEQAAAPATESAEKAPAAETKATPADKGIEIKNEKKAEA